MLSSSHSKGVQLSQSFYFGVCLFIPWTCSTLFCVPGESSVQGLFRKRDQCGIASMQTPCSLQVFILEKKNLSLKVSSFAFYQVRLHIFMRAYLLDFSAHVCFGAMFCCRNCSEKCKKCPFCRVTIEERLPVYDV